mmetsp:Transcript_18638/g.51827  ORF Transcript_18638/g.51827 Transcript_18638/m.51827 type:complete len:132 (+) Transcript_18638:870-1265(+)
MPLRRGSIELSRYLESSALLRHEDITGVLESVQQMSAVDGHANPIVAVCAADLQTPSVIILWRRRQHPKFRQGRTNCTIRSDADRTVEHQSAHCGRGGAMEVGWQGGSELIRFHLILSRLIQTELIWVGLD